MSNRNCEVPGLAPRRKAAGLSQKALAALLDVNEMTVMRWETGATDPSLEMLRKLAELLECSVPDLLSPDGKQTFGGAEEIRRQTGLTMRRRPAQGRRASGRRD